MERQRRTKEGTIRKNREGESYITIQGCKATIIKYHHNENIDIIFDNGSFRKGITFASLKRGNVYNFYHPVACDIGYFGEGNYSKSKNYNAYNAWRNMIDRCYNKKFQEKHITYKEVTVCEEWHNFQNFAKWFEDNYNPKTMEGWHLDKDILFPLNKIYSSDTCCFVPQEINVLFVKNNKNRGKYPIGVSKANKKYVASVTKNNVPIKLGRFDTPEEAFQAYKTAKEKYIKEVADKWKDQITEQVYKALINYQIEITD